MEKHMTKGAIFMFICSLVAEYEQGLKYFVLNVEWEKEAANKAKKSSNDNHLGIKVKVSNVMRVNK